MKNYLILLVSLVISTSSIAQWQEIDYYPTNNGLYDIDSPDGQNIYI